MAAIRLFSYEDKNTLIHKLHPIVKTAIFIILNILIFKDSCRNSVILWYSCRKLFNNNFIVSFFIFIFLIIILIKAKLNIIEIFKKSVFLIYLGSFALIFGSLDFSLSEGLSFNRINLLNQSVFVFRLITSFLAAEIFLAVTEISSINDLITIFVRNIPLVRKIDFGLYISLSINFIPRIFMEYDNISSAFLNRGGYSVKNPLRKSLIIFNPLIINMIRKAIVTAYALEVRNHNIKRTIIIEPLRSYDYSVIFITLILFLISQLLWFLKSHLL